MSSPTIGNGAVPLEQEDFEDFHLLGDDLDQTDDANGTSGNNSNNSNSSHNDGAVQLLREALDDLHKEQVQNQNNADRETYAVHQDHDGNNDGGDDDGVSEDDDDENDQELGNGDHQQQLPSQDAAPTVATSTSTVVAAPSAKIEKKDTKRDRNQRKQNNLPSTATSNIGGDAAAATSSVSNNNNNHNIQDPHGKSSSANAAHRGVVANKFRIIHSKPPQDHSEEQILIFISALSCLITAYNKNHSTLSMPFSELVSGVFNLIPRRSFSRNQVEVILHELGDKMALGKLGNFASTCNSFGFGPGAAHPQKSVSVCFANVRNMKDTNAFHQVLASQQSRLVLEDPIAKFPGVLDEYTVNPWRAGLTDITDPFGDTFFKIISLVDKKSRCALLAYRDIMDGFYTALQNAVDTQVIRPSFVTKLMPVQDRFSASTTTNGGEIDFNVKPPVPEDVLSSYQKNVLADVVTHTRGSFIPKQTDILRSLSQRFGHTNPEALLKAVDDLCSLGFLRRFESLFAGSSMVMIGVVGRMVVPSSHWKPLSESYSWSASMTFSVYVHRILGRRGVLKQQDLVRCLVHLGWKNSQLIINYFNEGLKFGTIFSFLVENNNNNNNSDSNNSIPFVCTSVQAKVQFEELILGKGNNNNNNSDSGISANSTLERFYSDLKKVVPQAGLDRQAVPSLMQSKFGWNDARICEKFFPVLQKKELIYFTTNPNSRSNVLIHITNNNMNFPAGINEDKHEFQQQQQPQQQQQQQLYQDGAATIQYNNNNNTIHSSQDDQSSIVATLKTATKLFFENLKGFLPPEGLEKNSVMILMTHQHGWKDQSMQQEFLVELCAKHLIHERSDPSIPGLVKLCLGAPLQSSYGHNAVLVFQHQSQQQLVPSYVPSSQQQQNHSSSFFIPASTNVAGTNHNNNNNNNSNIHYHSPSSMERLATSQSYPRANEQNQQHFSTSSSSYQQQQQQLQYPKTNDVNNHQSNNLPTSQQQQQPSNKNTNNNNNNVETRKKRLSTKEKFMVLLKTSSTTKKLNQPELTFLVNILCHFNGLVKNPNLIVSPKLAVPKSTIMNTVATFTNISREDRLGMYEFFLRQKILYEIEVPNKQKGCEGLLVALHSEFRRSMSIKAWYSELDKLEGRTRRDDGDLSGSDNDHDGGDYNNKQNNSNENNSKKPALAAAVVPVRNSTLPVTKKDLETFPYFFTYFQNAFASHAKAKHLNRIEEELVVQFLKLACVGKMEGDSLMSAQIPIGDFDKYIRIDLRLLGKKQDVSDVVQYLIKNEIFFDKNNMQYGHTRSVKIKREAIEIVPFILTFHRNLLKKAEINSMLKVPADPNGRKNNNNNNNNNSTSNNNLLPHHQPLRRSRSPTVKVAPMSSSSSSIVVQHQILPQQQPLQQQQQQLVNVNTNNNSNAKTQNQGDFDFFYECASSNNSNNNATLKTDSAPAPQQQAPQVFFDANGKPFILNNGQIISLNAEPPKAMETKNVMNSNTVVDNQRGRNIQKCLIGAKDGNPITFPPPMLLRDGIPVFRPLQPSLLKGPPPFVPFEDFE